MTKPNEALHAMTPRDDVEALCDNLKDSLGAALHRLYAITMLRALLAERDAQKAFREECERQLQKSFDDLASMMAERDGAYQRGQEDMRLTAALKVVSLVNDGCALIDMDVHILALPIKETPDA